MSNLKKELKNEFRNELGSKKSSIFSLVLSFAKRACFWSIVYSIGSNKLNPVWIIVPLSISTLEKYAKTLKLSGKKTEASACDISSVPRWVFFPDTDRAEWVNKIIAQLWPNLQNNVTDQLNAIITAAAYDENSKSWITKLQISKSSIGRIPLQIGGVKVFKNNDILRKEIILDIEIVLATDCDLAVKYLPFLYVSLRDLYLYGTIRVTLKPLLEDLPIVGGVEVTFLSVPYIDFDLGGVANIVDLPGLSRIVRNIVLEQIGALAVIPNAIYIPLTYEQPKPKESYKFEAVDLVRLTIRGARNLMGKDIKFLGSSTSDPFLKLRYGKYVRKSEISIKTLNPQWNLQAEFLVEKEDNLELEVWDWNKITDDDFLGKKTLSKDELFQIKGKTSWVKVQGVKSGEICLDVDYLKLTSNISDYEFEKINAKEGYCSTVLFIYLDSARNLERNKKCRAPSPVVNFSISGRSPRPSSVAPFTQNPVYEEEIRLLVPNPDCDDLTVRVTDAKTQCSLGNLKICLSEILYSNLEMKCQPVKLHQSGSGGFLVMGMKLMFPKSCS